MGNLFFNIGQLTDYLIGDSIQPAKTAVNNRDGVKFEEFIESLIGKNRLTASGKTPDIFKLFTGDTGGEAESAELIALRQILDLRQNQELAGNHFADGRNGQPLIADITCNDVFTAGGPLSDTAITNGEIEKYDVVPVQVSSVKRTIMKTPDMIPVKLENPGVSLNSSSVYLSELPGGTADLKLSEGPVKDDPSGQGINSSRQPAGQNSYNAPVTAENAISTGTGLDWQNIILDLKELLDESKSLIKADACSAGSLKAGIHLDYKAARAIIDNQPKGVPVEIELNDRTAEDSNITSPAPGKFMVVDLKSLLRASDSEQIKVIVKSIENAPQQESVFNLLKDLNLGRGSSARFKNKESNDIFGKGTSLTGNTAKAGLNVSNQIKNETMSASREPDQKPGPADQHSKLVSKDLKAAVNQSPKAMAGSYPGQDRYAADTALGSQGEIKSVQISAGIRSPESYPGSKNPADSIEYVESILDQVRSKLMSSRGGTRIVIDLQPEYLGKIKIDFKYEKDRIETVFKVQNADVKAILDAELPKLKHEFKIDSFKVNADISDLDRNPDLAHRHNASGEGIRNNYAKPRESNNESGDKSASSIDGNANLRSGFRYSGAIDILA